MACLHPSSPLVWGLHGAEHCSFFFHLRIRWYGCRCSKCPDHAGELVPGSACHLFCYSAFLICNMPFPLNLYDFYWIPLSFDSKVLKRERSCQLVHRLQKSVCVCVCVCVRLCVRTESPSPISGFMPHIYNPPLCSISIPLSHFPFGAHLKVRKLHLTTIFVLAKYYTESSCNS